MFRTGAAVKAGEPERTACCVLGKTHVSACQIKTKVLSSLARGSSGLREPAFITALGAHSALPPVGTGS